MTRECQMRHRFLYVVSFGVISYLNSQTQRDVRRTTETVDLIVPAYILFNNRVVVACKF